VKWYEFCVRGGSRDVLKETFADLSVCSRPEGMVLEGLLPDQAAMFGTLETINDLGLELVWFKELDEKPGTAPPSR
jgi:hypothetical protein